MTEPNSLVKKLSACMKAIGYLKKDGRNQSQNYSYLSEAKVKETCQREFTKHGLVATWDVSFPHISEREVNGKSGIDVICLVTLIVTDDFRTISTQGCGQGRDNGDKAAMKAQTAAIRECLKSLFLVPSGDDPEADTSVDEEGKSKGKGKAPKGRKKVDHTSKQAELIARIEKADTTTAIDDLKAVLVAETNGMPAELRDPLREAYRARVKSLMVDKEGK